MLFVIVFLGALWGWSPSCRVVPIFAISLATDFMVNAFFLESSVADGLFWGILALDVAVRLQRDTGGLVRVEWLDDDDTAFNLHHIIDCLLATRSSIVPTSTTATRPPPSTPARAGREGLGAAPQTSFLPSKPAARARTDLSRPSARGRSRVCDGSRPPPAVASTPDCADSCATSSSSSGP